MVAVAKLKAIGTPRKMQKPTMPMKNTSRLPLPIESKTSSNCQSTRQSPMAPASTQASSIQFAPPNSWRSAT